MNLKEEMIILIFHTMGLLAILFSIINYFRGVDLGVCLSSAAFGIIWYWVGNKILNKFFKSKKE